MLTGFYVLKGGGVKYTPAFPRGGLAALFSLEILGLVGSPSGMTATVEHKDVVDTSWSPNQSFASITSTGVKTQDVTGIQELVRISFLVTASNDWEGFYLLIPAPAWRPN
jgi:hypothetical protein